METRLAIANGATGTQIVGWEVKSVLGPFDVTKELIACLEDEPLRKLLGKLLESEAVRRGIALSGIAVGGNQTAGDGGVDASITWTGSPKPTDWLPRRNTVFQCKAETMAAAALTKEMRPKGKARSLFVDLVRCRGAYIVFSTDDVANTGYQKRVSAMVDALSDVTNSKRIHLDFLGADRIARWVNQHPGVALEVLEAAGRSVRGWRPYGGWSTPNQSSTAYLYDDRSRARVDGNDVESISAITAMRRELRTAGGSVRLVGISGMGKTRLAEAIFDLALDPDTAIPPSRAIYGDAGTELGVGSALLAEQLVAGGAEAVIVVDNCTARLHKQLSEIVGRPGSRSSLLTVDYDTGDDQPGNTLVVSLGANSDDLIAALLAKRHPKLSLADRRHVAEFADGNARVALKVAESAEDGVSLAKLNDTELLARLFQTGRQDLGRFSRQCAQAASLVYAFYMEHGDQIDIEYPILAGIAGVSAQEFYREIANFLDWGIVQQRGPQRAVMPPPIANMLAGEALRRLEPTALAATFIYGPDRLFASFARRLGFLHHVEQAVALATMLFSSGECLGQPQCLADSYLKAFIHLAPAAPEAALAAIERTLAGPDCSDFVAAKHLKRIEFAELLVNLAHEPALFPRSMDALLVFVLAEPLERNEKSVLKHFLERFWIIQSFTLSDFHVRSAYIDRLLDGSDERVRRVGLEALDHMLNAGNFNSSLESRFGTRSRAREWRPSGLDDQKRWFEAGLHRLVQIACCDGAESDRAREIVARHIRDHVRLGYADLAVPAVRRIREGRYWDDGWNAVSDTLSFDRNSMSDEVLADMQSLEVNLRPSKPNELFEAFVLGEPWRHSRPAGREMRPARNTGKLAQALGKCIARTGSITASQIDLALGVTGETAVREFGVGLARATNDVAALWGRLLAVYRSKAGSWRNPTLLAGFLSGAVECRAAWVDNQLDAMIDDPDLQADIVFMHPNRALGSQAMLRFSRALAAGMVHPSSFRGLMYGGVSKSIPAPDLRDFLAQLYTTQNGSLAAVNVLHMRVFGDRSDNRAIAPELVELSRAFVSDQRTYIEGHARDDFAIADLVKLALAGDQGSEIAATICRAIRNLERPKNRHLVEFEKVCELIRDQYLRVVLDEIVGHQDSTDTLVDHFFGRLARDGDGRRSNISIDADIALQWVSEDPSIRSVRLASFIPYAVADITTRDLQWTPLSRALIEIAPDPLAVLNVFERRFSTGSTSGSFSSRFVRHRPLLNALSDHWNRSIRNWVRQAQQRLEDSVMRWDMHDRNQESRFE